MDEPSTTTPGADSPPSPRRLTIAIIGGGIAGVTLTVALLKRGLDVHLYERYATFEEIGAGIGFRGNFARAMSLCDPKLKEAFDRVKTDAGIQGQETVWFNWFDGYRRDDQESLGGEGEEGEGKGGGLLEGDGGDRARRYMFTLRGPAGGGGCNRAHFLDEAVKLVPDGVACFRKYLDTVEEAEDQEGGLVLRFRDGSTATADAVIGCDGIRSRVRQCIVGKDSPQAKPQYSHDYAYRALVPMDKVIEAVGSETALTRTMHVGPNGHVVIYPVANRKFLNVAAFRHDPGPWPHERHDVPVDPARLLSDWADWSPAIVKISHLLQLDKDLDCWAIFDLGDHPLSTYTRGRMCVLGDAAHASSPHFGAGAGMGIEDSAVMAELLSSAQQKVLSGQVPRAKAIQAAFGAFDASRRERTQWLVQSSRFCSMVCQGRGPAGGWDVERRRQELDARTKVIWNFDVEDAVRDALADLEGRLGKD